jgi:transcriptional regulator with XRE-family HTH domain
MYRSMERKVKPGVRWHIEGFNHAQPYPGGNLYHAVRQIQGQTVAGMAREFGTTRRRWQYREQGKRMYRVAEIMALYEASELTPEQFIKLLSKIA